MKRISLYFIMLILSSLSIGVQAKTVTVTEAGTLSTLLSKEELTSLTELIVSGPLNGDDILTIRATAATLETLNMTNASIVAGGSSYYGIDKFTSDNMIGDKMFYSMTALKKLMLPNSVTYIGEKNYNNGDGEAIGRCVNLETVKLPTSLLSIGSNAFNYCIRLTSVEIPEGVEFMGRYAFQNCKALTSVSLPSTLGKPNKIEYYRNYKHFVYYDYTNSEYVPRYNSPESSFGHTFSGCDKLSTVTLAEGLEALTFNMFENCQALTSVTLPSSMKALNGAFVGTGISSITLPSGLIQVYSFNNCTKLVSVTIPEGTGYVSFQGCTSLKSIKLPNTLTSIQGSAFGGCTQLSSITIPEKVTTINEQAFDGCTSLETVQLPAALTTIKVNAFRGCSKLAKIVLPEKVNDIGDRGFQDCTALRSINFPLNIVQIGESAFRNCISLESITLPPNLTSISTYLFNGCSKLKEVTLPAGLATIGNSAFADCIALKEIIIPGGVQTISSGSFSRCGLEKVTLKMGIISVENGAFSECMRLKDVIFPESMTTISGFNNTGIQNITFPKNVLEIGESAFVDCDSLRTLTIPNGVQAIKNSAFSGCDSLKVVTLPSTLQTIGSGTFESTNLKEITIPEGVKEIEHSTFRDCDSLAVVNLPKSLTKISNNYERWSSSGVPSGGAFSGCHQLQNITLPEGLIEIGVATFAYCINLKEITIPEGIKEINSATFWGCTRLATVKLPQSLTKIINDNSDDVDWRIARHAAFSECYLLKNINFPVALTEIGRYTFHKSGLTDLNIPSTITTIGDGAFTCEYGESVNGVYITHKLNSVVWNSPNQFPAKAFSKMTYLYLPQGTTVSDESIAKYIFRGGVTDAMKIEATNGRFSINQELKAKQVTYSKRFDTQSGYNEAAGWRTIVLPFTVDKFTYTGNSWEDNGTENLPLAPFGSDVLTTDDSARPFWLYELTTGGTYQAATKLEANKPYLICMPNNYAYPESSNISGWVRFSAESEAGVTLAVTEGSLHPADGATFKLIPTYETVSKSEQVYALNESDSYGEYPIGSVFIRNYANVEPFQAYLQTKEAQNRAPMLYSIGDGGGNITGLDNMVLTPDKAVKVRSEHGIIYIESNAARLIRIYDVSGRTVHTLEAQEGSNEVNGLSDGIYFLEGQKVIVRK